MRDIPYGSNPRQVLDVFAPTAPGASRTVLLFIPGGGGNKMEPFPDAEPFCDNIMLWAVKNGMTGVNMQRWAGRERAWDDPGRGHMSSVFSPNTADDSVTGPILRFIRRVK